KLADCLEQPRTREEEWINVWRAFKPTIVHRVIRMAIPKRVVLVFGKPDTRDAHTHVGIWGPNLFQADDIAEVDVELRCRQDLRHLVGANVVWQTPGVKPHIGAGLRVVKDDWISLCRG